MKQPSCNTFHTLWTKPVTTAGKHFEMSAAEILTMIVSALMWRKYNGSIKLYTDKAGYEFVSKNNLLELWDGGIDTDVLENNCYPIDPKVFWAAGKLMALEDAAAPCVMLDTDLVVMKPVATMLATSDITALHAEALAPDAYLPSHLLKKPSGYTFPDYYNWEVLPANTAFLYIRDEKFKRFYLDESKKFMFRNVDKPAEMVSQMVFAEQRLLTMCADHSGLPVDHLLADPFSQANDLIIHLWGFKESLRKSDTLQTIFSKQLFSKLAVELSAYPVFKNYIEVHYPDFLLVANRLVNEKLI
ncbi:MAG TPA: DUF6734 family protein [Paludibacter sp.]|nr:DUF6734 family protein [Paludibacter sp.]